MRPRSARKCTQQGTHFLAIGDLHKSSRVFPERMQLPLSIELIFDLAMYLG